MLSLISTGDTVRLCPFCLPPYVSAFWQMAGLPELVFDVPDQAAAEAGGIEADLSRSDPGTVTVTAYDPPEEEPPDSDGEDEATPEEPGVIELAERRDGPFQVKPRSYRKPKSDQYNRGADEVVEEEPSEATNDHG